MSVAALGAFSSVAVDLLKWGMAKDKNVKVPLMIECLKIIATATNSDDLDTNFLWLNAEELMKKLIELDNSEEVQKFINEIDEDFGGEQ